jgi:uncharacterized protein YbjT (DUF2867 family)
LSESRERVVLAGASGFVGRAVLELLAERFEVVALTQRSPAAPAASRPHVTWRTCDLFSQIQLEDALQGATWAVYLVHSLLPVADLVQGAAADRALLLAENFAVCAERAGLRQIVHIADREVIKDGNGAWRVGRSEVEETFRSHKVPVTTLRASVVLGQGGVTQDILWKLVDRLSTLPLPVWAELPVRPIAVDDLANAVVRCVGDLSLAGQSVDAGGPEALTFHQLLELAANARGLSRQYLLLGGRWLWSSSVIIALITGVPRARIRALIESLLRPTLHDDRWLERTLGHAGRRPADILVRGSTGAPELGAALAPRGPHVQEVLSVQRLPLPRGWNAVQVTQEYARWLPRFLFSLLEIQISPEGHWSMRVKGFRESLLELTFAPERSTPHRQLFYITGGALARQQQGIRPRLEFRVILEGQAVLSAIHDFLPRLPFTIYRFTQALIHAVVMAGFRWHLGRVRGHVHPLGGSP